MLRIVLALVGLVALSSCCQSRCAPHAVYVLVTADGASVTGVEIDGADFVCNEQDAATVCTPNGGIENGDYELVVRAPGYDAVAVSLSVRTYEPPAFSCDCRGPIGDAMVELGGGEPAPDAGEPMPDAGASDGG